MLLSMTGFGEAHRKDASLAISAEVRTINSRYFKLVTRCGEGYGTLEPQIENLVRQHIKRGTVQVSLRVERTQASDDFRINASVLSGYLQQLEELRKIWKLASPVGVEALLALPGVVNENLAGPADAAADWPLIGETLQAAIDNMTVMRTDEGRAMAADLAANCRAVAKELDAIELRAPWVSDSYRTRLTERLTKSLAEFQITLQPGDLIREISIYAERSDISEEIVRLRSHLEQFADTLELAESAGRKLEFLTQEMFREANTIGSKANDVQISRHVIEIKSAIERIREMIQNV
ncbi:MAG TPA: YicC/YloC family endoribonuclease, partial [Pirellulales bacterium]|nr:YicC/YloC family endoribonuclease [Pirellulales bacterium]